MARYSESSLYRTTPITENKYLDILKMDLDLDQYETTTYTLTVKHENRPDRLAYELYGNPKLWWIFAFFNQDILIDPIVNFTAGITITVPTSFN